MFVILVFFSISIIDFQQVNVSWIVVSSKSENSVVKDSKFRWNDKGKHHKFLKFKAIDNIGRPEMFCKKAVFETSCKIHRRENLPLFETRSP